MIIMKMVLCLFWFNCIGTLNDLWKYDLATNTWIFITGGQSVDEISNYVFPYPGGLDKHAMVIDSSGDHLYIFGGRGFGGTFDKGLTYL